MISGTGVSRSLPRAITLKMPTPWILRVSVLILFALALDIQLHSVPLFASAAPAPIPTSIPYDGTIADETSTVGVGKPPDSCANSTLVARVVYKLQRLSPTLNFVIEAATAIGANDTHVKDHVEDGSSSTTPPPSTPTPPSAADAYTDVDKLDRAHLTIDTKFGRIRGIYQPPEFSIRDFLSTEQSQKDPARFEWGRAFLGLPFAEAPVGERRFAPAKPWTASWNVSAHPKPEECNIQQQSGAASSDADGPVSDSTTPEVTGAPMPEVVLVADRYQSACCQLLTVERMSEDCLFLNVYVPPKKRMDAMNGKLLPVMVWFYGGSYLIGDGYSYGVYDGGFVTKQKDVVLVTFNYRLGALGFMMVSNGTLTGNYAYHDSLTALRWIKENIASFGGDAERITIFGMSSGAALTAFISVDPLAPTIQNAIVMSAPFAIATKSKHSMNVIGDSIANRLGCLHVGNATATIKCLRTRTSLDIVFHASQDMTSLEFDSIDGNPVGDALIWGPSFDGVHINGTLMKMLANPSPAVKERLSKMSVMVGTSQAEFDFFLAPATLNGELGNVYFYLKKGRASWPALFNHSLPLTAWRKFTNALGFGNITGVNTTAINSTDSLDQERASEPENIYLYRNVVAQSFSGGDLYGQRTEQIMEVYKPADDDALNLKQYKEMMNDYMFRCSARKFLNDVSQYTERTYFYNFRHKISYLAPVLGPRRALIELKGAPHALEFPLFFNKFPPLRDDNDQAISRWMIDRFTAFAHDGAHPEDAWHPYPLSAMTKLGLGSIHRTPVDRAWLAEHNATTNMTWPEYRPDTGAYMEFDTPLVSVKQKISKPIDKKVHDRCDFWDKLSRVPGSTGYDF